MHVERVNAAIRECLDRCYISNNPSAEIAAYLKELMLLGWTPDEIADTRSCVLRILLRIATPREAATAEIPHGGRS
jgi:hypothetical protein